MSISAVAAAAAGGLEEVNIETVNNGSQKDATMAFRRHLVIRGVLNQIIAETYRRSTVEYEESKLAENGDVWSNGALNL